MKQMFIATREQLFWKSGKPSRRTVYLTGRDGWSSKFEDALCFPTVEAAETKLRGRNADVVHAMMGAE